MWIVRLALRRPYTIAVSAVLILLLGIMSIRAMLVDIFPVIDIPVVGIVWAYPGLSSEDMERRVNIITERAMSTTVSGISRIESLAIPGIGLLRVYFEQGSDIGGAIAQIAAVTATATRSMPPGITPPIVVRFNASNVPVAQFTLSSDSMPEEQIFDYALNFIRIKLFTIPGLSTPAPYGGKSRQINIDVDPDSISAKGISAQDVVNALQASNLIIPAGTVRLAGKEFNVALNSSPLSVKEFEDLPIKVVGGAPITIGDVSKVNDAFADQTNIVRVNGKRASYLNILKKADASTLTVVNAARAAIPGILALAPKGLNLKMDFDQSTFVKGAISSVLREAVIAAILVSIMILFFLGSWRSVIIVCTSIPLAIFVSIIGLNLSGNTINIMTLGGLSLAIGMLVDDATVEVENIHRNRLLGYPLTVAILRGAQQIALPAIMATLAICIVFFPVVLLTGPARFLFKPMAASVVMAMLASYVLSRSLVPLLSRMLMEKEDLSHHNIDHNAAHDVEAHANLDRMARFNIWREKVFGKLVDRYSAILETVLAHRKFILYLFFGSFAITLVLPFIVGTDFFPSTDTGIMKLHFRAPSGTRIEITEQLVSKLEDRIRKIIGPEDLETINSMIGVPTSYNMAFVPTDNVSGMDAELLIALKEGHRPTAKYMQQIRKELPEEFPGSSLYFQAADIVNQVLNFGLSAPIDVQFDYPNIDASYKLAKVLRDKMKGIPGAVDVNIKQVFDYPTLRINVDRTKAAQVGVAQRDVANSMLIALSSSSLVSPSYFLSPVNGVNYTVNVKVPMADFASVDDLLSTSITNSTAAFNAAERNSPLDVPEAQSQTLRNLASIETQTTLNSVNHNNVQRVVNVTANVEGSDLGSVVSRINKAIGELGKLPPGMKVSVRGQSEVMYDAFFNMGIGLLLAIALVYLLMVVLFQSWLDPFIVLVAIPGALTGILWMLLFTGTTINVESFMGAIMAVGIAASNSILLVAFANDVRIEKGLGPMEAAFEAGRTRLRPVLMTALAMILGMLPAAMGLGEGGEQNAPLGRAVIGGLLVATFVTLFVVPVVYSLLRLKMPTAHEMDEKLKREEEQLHSGTPTLHPA
jgi:multidrug efflux pump subunit AcrB